MRRWIVVAAVAAALLVACGGGSKDATSTSVPSGAASGAPTAVTGSAPTAAAGDAPTATGQGDTSGSTGSTDAEGAKHLPLKAGTTAEVQADGGLDTIDESGNLPQGPLKVTLGDIHDPAQGSGVTGTPDPGNRFWAIDVTVEATGDKEVNNGQWTAHGSDGKDYGTVYLTGVGEDIIYGTMQPGEKQQGVVVFQIPEGVTVTSVHLSASVYQGLDVYFDS